MNEKNDLDLVFPRINPEDFEIDVDIKQMGYTIGPIPEELIRKDPRLRAILGEDLSGSPE